MKMILTKLLVVLCAVLAVNQVRADGDWPKVINADDGSQIKIYEPQPESFVNNTLKARAAISVIENGKSEPIFGTYWFVAKVETDRDNRRVLIQSIKVPNIKFPGVADTSKIKYLKSTLEAEIPKLNIDISLDDLESQLDMDQQQSKLSKGLNNDPPKIVYTNKSSILVTIDGAPKLQHNDDWNLDAVVNTPFTIVKNNDGRFYLYGDKHWYMASSATGPYNYVGAVPANLSKVEDAINSSAEAGYTNDSATAQENTIPDIIVSTEPTELIQSNGEANMAPIEGTNLLYVSNSSNDIFMDINSQQYYVLISGRWFASTSLQGKWQYIAASSLPADFKKIPEGSPKDNVLASVAGTPAAKEAVMDAQIPQTAKVDRQTATASVAYDGEPKFEAIPNTSMEYAINTSGSVILWKGRYYCVDKGVWFVSNTANGPWAVATDRPDDVELIPPDNPMYNLKYVYVYDVTPDYVYMGYTPGYLNTFIYGPTVVYGTGFYYRPWFYHHYYPRPYTWGFNMNYNPWTGWNIGFGFSYGWFNGGIGVGWGYGGGGWWGPPVYRPPYCWGGYRPHGYYGKNSNFNHSAVNYNINRNRTNNIYNYRRDVVTRDNTRYNANRPLSSRPGNGYTGRPSQLPGVPHRPSSNNGMTPGQARSNNGYSSRPSQMPSNNVTTDRSGNVYQRNNQNQWQQRDANQWRNVNNNRSETLRSLDRQQQMVNRGQQRTQTFERARSSAPSGGGNSRPSGNSGGGGRSGGNSGGGGGHRR